MGYYDETIECPYCGKDTEFNPDFEGADSNDTECEHCGKEFEVLVEYMPTYSTLTIDYNICKDCGREYRITRSQDKCLCENCNFKREVEKNKNNR